MTKIDIISGFLGAGKTTLIKKLLADAFKGQKVVLVENGERGEETFISRGIDETGALLVEDSEGEIKRIISGEVSVRGVLGYV